MLLIIISLSLGLIIGYFELIPDSLESSTDKLITVGLILLLFNMGAEIGLNDKVIANLDKLGLQALILAMGSILGSILIVKFLENLVGDFRKENQKGR
ncbi:MULTISPECIES: LysO family transporter [unclassified Candidatus Frackibacter]|uniref:LysO family transporter n=1 Tax=unclassified Candidatus Frackibacter TaxID=2648818 RepID=UPI000796899E|nr:MULTISPECIES: LysO family transporter [unclassified Candidatus Frackibacter]KXS40075.1 MAG: hypothetical protein AWU54_2106 [Candidatus Frackibacter sp. T328-2]SDC35378.1 Membrane protein of unknown function [Candidatus Frackibacter sp. WG11]SEM56039.1 Membrane protein of unknown function [Candidatus Frackibacter sp. WG12]SFL71245.1 Membrane protein of unknown function [Candidatus Frackibacter sp. WG13]